MSDDSKCPFQHAAGGGTTIRDWWPTRLRVDLLYLHSEKSNPLGPQFDYVDAFNSLDFAAALRKAGVQFDLHIYTKGAHGLGLGSREYNPEKWHPWTRDCAYWLKEQGFAK